MNDGKIRIGFIVKEGTWLGGLNYFRNLFAAIRLLEDCKITPVVITGTLSNPEREFPGVEVLKTTLLDRHGVRWLAGQVLSRAFGQDLLLKEFLLKHRIRVLSHSGNIGQQSAIATTGWIPDFQHIHMPGYFSRKEVLGRNKDFKNYCRLCTRLILSSHDALDDLNTFSPEHVSKAEVLQFVAGRVPIDRFPSLEMLQDTYHFEGPYFHLPNQFWAHKNHRAIIDALRLLRGHQPNILVLATGPTHDYRNPQFFDSLMEYAKQCGVLDNFRVLGAIPFENLIGIMHHAVSLINPSKFEGWSTTVEESKTMGKRIILSNIRVHREQAPDHGAFFDPENSKELAELLVSTLSSYDKRADMANQEKAASHLVDRQREFARVFQRIIENALGGVS